MKRYLIKIIKSFFLNLILHFLFFTVIVPMSSTIGVLSFILMFFSPILNILCNMIETVNETGYYIEFTDSDLGLIIGNIILLLLSIMIFKGDSSFGGQLAFALAVYPLIINFFIYFVFYIFKGLVYAYRKFKKR